MQNYSSLELQTDVGKKRAYDAAVQPLNLSMGFTWALFYFIDFQYEI